MRRHLRPLSFLALLVLSAPVFSSAATGDEDVKKQRQISKSYTVSPSDKLDIENQFGSVVVSTWDKQEITVDVEIGVRAATENRAQDIMDRIEVKDAQDGHQINFKTKVDNIHGEKNSQSFYIDYVIHMPAGNPLTIENSFGKTEVPDLNGPVSLTSKFGSLTTGKLSNVDDIDVEFGKANIGEVNNGKVTFKFNKESIISNITGSVKINSEFSHGVNLTLNDNISDLTLNESYSEVRLVVDHNLSAQFNVHTSFGDFHNNSDFSINEHKDDNDMGPHFDKDYSGTAGDGKASIKIKSSFGHVRLSYDNDSRDRSREREVRSKARKDKDKDKEKGDDDDDNDKDTDKDTDNSSTN